MSNSEFNSDGTALYGKYVVVIGGVPIIPTTYNLITNKQFENDSMTFHIPMDEIDITTIYRKALSDKNLAVFVELWTGYVDSSEEFVPHTDEDDNQAENETIRQNLLEKYQDLLERKWIGYVLTYDLEYVEASNEEPDHIIITCSDPAKVLKEIMFEASFQGDNSRMENVINVINQHLPNFEIVFDKDVPKEKKDFLLGYEKKILKDDSEQEKEVKFLTKGKTYWQVLEEITSKTRLDMIADNANILNDGKVRYKLKTVYTSDVLWKLYRNKHFERARIRLGDISHRPTKKVAIKVKSAQSDNTTIEGTFPRFLSQTETTKIRDVEDIYYKVFIISNNRTQEYCELKAAELAENIAKFDITVELIVPNAIMGVKEGDAVQLYDDSREEQIKTKKRNYHSINFTQDNNVTKERPIFVINSITEDGDDKGISQKYEMHLDLNLNIINLNTGELWGKNLLPTVGTATTEKSEDLDPYFMSQLFAGHFDDVSSGDKDVQFINRD